MQSIEFKKTVLGGFWGKRQELNRTVTLPTVYNRFADTGRFDAFRFEWKEGDEKKPHIFWDSDVAKWLESAAYTLEQHPDKQLEARVDEVVDLIEKNQGDDGYFNIYFTVCEPDNRFCNRMAHELYCAGHLTEAAVAYRSATGKGKFLDCMCKYIDYIEKVFKIDDSAEFCTPGHEELELALVRLWEATGENRYLELARWFVDIRGTREKDFESPFYIDQAYSQSEKPVREMDTANGHCVRAVYLYSAMADLSRIDNDRELKAACRKLFDSIASRRMYITGGIGSSIIGEAFSEDYDLPNALAYAETCAAIGLALFAKRMTLLEADGIYADVAERAIYNGVLAGNSLDGKAFFYEDPLEINLHERELTAKHRSSKQHLAITQRVEVFDCSCCPPNFTRFIASIADFLYTQQDDTLFIHHYMQSRSAFNGITVTQQGGYPFDGNMRIEVKGAKTVAVRIPGWCKDYTLTADSRSFTGRTDRGYVYIPVNGEGTEIVLVFDMAPFLVEANPAVTEDIGKVALQRGPVVYCLEGVDNSAPLRSLHIDRRLSTKVLEDKALGCPVIEADGSICKSFTSLYRRYKGETESVKLRFIPYYAFANRGETDMLVWVR